MNLFPLLWFCAGLGVHAQPNLPVQASARAKQVIAYWTPGRRSAALPLDRVLEESANGSRKLMLRTGTNTESTHRQLQTTVQDGDWTAGGKINEAAGRLFFTRNGGNYVCSASVINDFGTAGRSLLATAAHCVYDEALDLYSYNYLFIPKQDDGGTDTSNRACSDDYYGCWVPTHTVIDSRWAAGTWSSNIPYDYAILVVPDSGAWTQGYNNLNNPILDNAVPPLEVDFTNEQGLVSGSLVQFHGYSYNKDPNFRYCRVQANSQTDRWVVPGCMLSGGASGGPCQPNTDGNGKLYTVVSYSYSSGGVQTGMGGARLNSNSFSCLYETAKTTTGNTIYSYSGTPCPITSNEPPVTPGCTINSGCDNGLFCDGAETCSNGSCQSGSNPCSNGQTCDETSNICVECLVDSECDNGLFCDGVETCSNGSCQSGSNPCNNGQTCNEASNICVECVVDSECDNGLFCDGAETCSNGSCQSGSNPCSNGQTCDETSNICVECLVDSECDNGRFCDGVETCSNGSCQSGSNPCSNGQTCDETSDICVECVVDSECSNGVFCDGVETCSNGICRSGSNPCSNGQTCNETNDTCFTSSPVCSAKGSTCAGRKGGACTRAGCVWCGGSSGCFDSVVGGCTCPV
ncbi:hypothetical protein ACA910_015923 [Epithemia clementina (nom. ined.)]